MRILFGFEWRYRERHVRRMRVGILMKGGVVQSLASRGISSGSRTSRVRCSSQIRVSIRLVSIIGIVTSRVGGVAEGVDVTVVPSMALTTLTVHVVVREGVVAEEAWWVVGNIGRNRESALGCRRILMGGK